MEHNFVDVTANNWADEVTNSDQVVCVIFGADWAGPCKMLMPILEEFSKKHPDVKMCYMDVDKNYEIVGTFGIMSVPHTSFYNAGELGSYIVGLVSLEKLEAKLEEVL